MTQEELGRILGVQKSAIQKYETGKVTDLRASTILKLSRTFSVYPWFFVYDDPSEGFRRLLTANIAADSEIKDLAVLAAERLNEAGYMSDVLTLMATITALNKEGFARIIAYASDLNKIDEYKQGYRPGN